MKSNCIGTILSISTLTQPPHQKNKTMTLFSLFSVDVI